MGLCLTAFFYINSAPFSIRKECSDSLNGILDTCFGLVSRLLIIDIIPYVVVKREQDIKINLIS